MEALKFPQSILDTEKVKKSQNAIEIFNPKKHLREAEDSLIKTCIGGQV